MPRISNLKAHFSSPRNNQLIRRATLADHLTPMSNKREQAEKDRKRIGQVAESHLIEMIKQMLDHEELPYDWIGFFNSFSLTQSCYREC